MERVNVVDRIATGDDEFEHIDLGGGKIRHVRKAMVEEEGTVINRALFEALQDNIMKYLIPIGMILPMALKNPPPYTLPCDGAAVSREDYADLFAAMYEDDPTLPWGAGDGSTTFNVPDYRGIVFKGWAASGGYDTGRAWASYQADQNKAHAHTLTIFKSGSSGNAYALGAGSSYKFESATTSTDPSSGGTEVRVKNKTVLYCIKY